MKNLKSDHMSFYFENGEPVHNQEGFLINVRKYMGKEGLNAHFSISTKIRLL